MEYASIGRVLISFAFVIALMFGVAWALKKIGIEKRLGARGKDGGQLDLEETLYLDPKRRIVIVKRGPKRHVVLLGTQSELLMESYDEKQDS